MTMGKLRSKKKISFTLHRIHQHITISLALQHEVSVYEGGLCIITRILKRYTISI